MTKNRKVGFASKEDPILKQFAEQVIDADSTPMITFAAKPELAPVAPAPAPAALESTLEATLEEPQKEPTFTLSQITNVLFKQEHQTINQSYNDLFYLLFKDNPDIVAVKRKHNIPIWLYGSILDSFNRDNQRYHISGRGNPVIIKKGKQ
jgi:hypothetical protein